MPPHCDSMDGPVVKAATRALDGGTPDPVLPFVPADGEDEVRAAFERTMEARAADGPAREIADRWFFETVVRVHRAGEGAPFTGLKPAGLGHGPVVPVAERALEEGDADELAALLAHTVEQEVRKRLARAVQLRSVSDGSVEAERAYVEAMLGLEVWSHKLYAFARSHPHEDGHGHGHG